MEELTFEFEASPTGGKQESDSGGSSEEGSENWNHS